MCFDPLCVLWWGFVSIYNCNRFMLPLSFALCPHSEPPFRHQNMGGDPISVDHYAINAPDQFSYSPLRKGTTGSSGGGLHETHETHETHGCMADKGTHSR